MTWGLKRLIKSPSVPKHEQAILWLRDGSISLPLSPAGIRQESHLGCLRKALGRIININKWLPTSRQKLDLSAASLLCIDVTQI